MPRFGIQSQINSTDRFLSSTILNLQNRIGDITVINGILYVNNKPLNQNKLLPVEIYNLEDLDTNTLKNIW